MLQQEVTAFPGPDLDEPRSLELPDDFSPRHIVIVNLSLGYVNAATQTKCNCEAGSFLCAMALAMPASC